jgi:hypothetical protein
MNLILSLIGLFFTIEGSINVVFYEYFKQYKSNVIFQAGRVLRALLGFVTFLWGVL